ncbi:hypothetical protein WAI453_004070 [Rhynchosporium graminicola]
MGVQLRHLWIRQRRAFWDGRLWRIWRCILLGYWDGEHDIQIRNEHYITLISKYFTIIPQTKILKSHHIHPEVQMISSNQGQ